MRQHQITRTAALAAAIAALAAPSALAHSTDLSSPDARDVGYRPYQDMRSPDAIDASEGRGTFNSPGVTVLKVAQEPAPQSSGVDWGDVSIGAGGALGVVAIGVGGAALLVRRPRRHPAPVR
jgi:hypothetical protein